MRYKLQLSHVSLVTFLIDIVAGHGRFLEPPSRVSMWRFGYNTPANYNDNQMFCGGFATQYNKNGGKCGVCGDDWSGVRDSEAPDGKYAKGIMVRRYQPGQIIKTRVEITANHKGWFQFKLCANDIPNHPVDADCFNKHILPNRTGSTRLYINNNPGMFEHELQLPAGVRCKHCVLQWRYHTANSWGQVAGQPGCIGCGDQEEFYGCADIVIGHDEIPLGVATGKQNIPQPSGPGDGQDNNWSGGSNSAQTGNNNDTKTNCNCPCASGSPMVTSSVQTVHWVIFISLAWLFFNF